MSFNSGGGNSFFFGYNNGCSPVYVERYRLFRPYRPATVVVVGGGSTVVVAGGASTVIVEPEPVVVIEPQPVVSWRYEKMGFVIPAGGGPQSPYVPFRHGPSRTFQP